MIEHLDGVKETVDYLSNARVRFYHNIEQEGYPLHWHAAAEVIMPMVGDYRLDIQNRPVLLHPGDIVFIAPGVLHTIVEPKAPGQRLIILFDTTIVNQFPEITTVNPFLTPHYLVTKENAPAVHSDLQDLLTSILQIELVNSPMKNIMIYAELAKLVAVLGNVVVSKRNSSNSAHTAYAEADSESESLTQANLSAIYNTCEYIRAHSREKITLESLAARAGFSKFYFSRLFKEISGMSFVDYLNSCRISDVEKLLADPEASVTDVALQAGFNSISTFNRVFKKVKDCTPQEFKRLGNQLQYSGRFQR